MPNSNKNKIDKLSLRQRAEEKLLKVGKVPNKQTALEMEHELNVHEIELQMQHDELLLANSKLTASLKDYAALFDFSPTAYFILDKEGQITKVNEMGCSLVGSTMGSLVGRPFSLLLNGEFYQDNFYRLRDLVIDTEQLQKLECDLERKNGDIITVLIISAIIKNENFEFKSFLVSVTDISTIRDNETRALKELQRANELNEMKSSFISMASHEFRTPLTAVLTGTWLIEKYLVLGNQEKIIQHLNKIRSSVKDLTLILEDFLSHDRLEDGKIEIKNESIDLPSFCEQILEDTRILLKEGQYLNYHHTGANHIVSDKKMLLHILTNLFSNARKYSEEGKEINVFTEVHPNKFIIKVQDYGIGIPKTAQQFIFTRFFRANNVANDQGTGLGLFIIKKFLDLVNGTIRFVSKEGEGSIFIVEIPILQGD